MNIKNELIRQVKNDYYSKAEYCKINGIRFKEIFKISLKDFVIEYYDTQLHEISSNTLSKAEITIYKEEIIEIIFYLHFLNELLYMNQNVKKDWLYSRDQVLSRLTHVFMKDKTKVIIENFIEIFCLDKRNYNLAINYSFFQDIEKQFPNEKIVKIDKLRNGVMKKVLNADKIYLKALLISNPIGLTVLGLSKILRKKKIKMMQYIHTEDFERLIKSLIVSKLIEKHYDNVT